MYMYVYLGEYVQMCPGAPGGQKKSDLPDLELQAITSHLKWALGTEPRSSGKVTHALNH